jgi:hypothetical protein
VDRVTKARSIGTAEVLARQSRTINEAEAVCALLLEFLVESAGACARPSRFIVLVEATLSKQSESFLRTALVRAKRPPSSVESEAICVLHDDSLRGAISGGVEQARSIIKTQLGCAWLSIFIIEISDVRLKSPSFIVKVKAVQAKQSGSFCETVDVRVCAKQLQAIFSAGVEHAG